MSKMLQLTVRFRNHIANVLQLFYRVRKEKKKKSRPLPSNWKTAATSDRHELYELSVQSVESEIDFVDDVWERRRGRPATDIR